MTKAKQAIQDARDEIKSFATQHYDLLDVALNLLADIEAGKVRVVPVEAAMGDLAPLESDLINYAIQHRKGREQNSYQTAKRAYGRVIDKAPPHEAETYLKGLK